MGTLEGALKGGVKHRRAAIMRRGPLVAGPGGTALVPLSHGKGHAVVDAIDAEAAAEWAWHRHQGNADRTAYALTTVRKGGKRGRMALHQLVAERMGIVGCKHVDHVNGDGLDNRRCNLRGATEPQNQWNHRRRTDNASGYIGVSWHRQNKKWTAAIQHHRRRLYLGVFRDAADAARAYDDAARKLFGAFARLNGQRPSQPDVEGTQ